MSIGILSKTAIRYQVRTPLYQGPLDLLLQLIEKAELDISQLALAQVTDQFLVHLQSLEHLETEEISYFIVIATKLLFIKSQMLLPRTIVEVESEEEIGEDLVNQLKEYKKFREIASFLADRESQGLRSYLRLAPPPRIESKLDLNDLDLQTFLLAAQNVFQNELISPELHRSIIKPQYSIKDQIQKIINVLKIHGMTTFHTLINPLNSRSEVITMFLALLELIKQRQIEIHQADLFDDIEIIPTTEIFSIDNLESEFEE
ncbi:MAG: ScpA family protein [Anaerolineales bacterium]